MKNVIRTALLLMPILSILAVLCRTLFIAGNHIGFSPYLLIVLSLPCVLYGLFVEKRLSSPLVLFGILNIVVLVFVVESNLLLDYETWAQDRHMPDKPFGIQ